jgi:hypothetical protein
MVCSISVCIVCFSLEINFIHHVKWSWLVGWCLLWVIWNLWNLKFSPLPKMLGKGYTRNGKTSKIGKGTVELEPCSCVCVVKIRLCLFLSMDSWPCIFLEAYQLSFYGQVWFRLIEYLRRLASNSRVVPQIMPHCSLQYHF